MGVHGGQPGRYRVVMTLWRPRFSLRPERDFATEESMQGDSHLQIASGGPSQYVFTITLLAGATQIAYKGYSNERSMIGKFVVEELTAASHMEAESLAYSGLAPYLSLLATKFDLPLDIYQTDVVELATGTRTHTYINAYYEITASALPIEAIGREERGFLSVYREAIVTNSPAYQFLLFYKICEELFKRRGRLGPQVGLGQRPAFAPLRIPTEPTEVLAWLRSVYPLQPHWDDQLAADTVPPEARGRNLRDVMDTYLRAIRDRVAHALFDLEEDAPVLLQSFDNGDHLNEIHKWLSFIRTAARWHIHEDVGITW